MFFYLGFIDHYLNPPLTCSTKIYINIHVFRQGNSNLDYTCYSFAKFMTCFILFIILLRLCKYIYLAVCVCWCKNIINKVCVYIYRPYPLSWLFYILDILVDRWFTFLIKINIYNKSIISGLLNLSSSLIERRSHTLLMNKKYWDQQYIWQSWNIQYHVFWYNLSSS